LFTGRGRIQVQEELEQVQNQPLEEVRGPEQSSSDDEPAEPAEQVEPHESEDSALTDYENMQVDSDDDLVFK